jgi:hypothetical protein
MKNKMSLKDWQAALDAERAKGLRRGSTLPKQAPTMQKIPSLQNEPHATRKSNSNMVADQDSTCFDDLCYSQSGSVLTTALSC